MGVATPAGVSLRRDQHVVPQGGQVIAANRTSVRDRLAIVRKPNRPPWSRWQAAGHLPILARGVRATLATGALVGITVVLAVRARSERERRALRARVGKRERHFGLLADESAGRGLERIALGQLDLAIELLHGESKAKPERAVHDTRKALKRLRALLRLLEDELGSESVARERATLDDAARRLAGARDAEVMVDTLDELIRRRPRRLAGKRGVRELRGHLERERARAAARTFGGPAGEGKGERGDAGQRDGAAANGPGAAAHGELALVAQVLIGSRARVQRWTLSERSAESILAGGVKRVYRDGRRRWSRVAGGKRSGKAFHRWRKEVKDLRYTAEVLDVREHPRAKGSTRASERLAKLARRADALSETLGAEHDLAVLAELVREHEPLRAHKRSRRALLRAIDHRQARLRRHALRAGASLYTRKPKRFMRWLRAF